MQGPKTRYPELIQYLEFGLNSMKNRIQDYLGLPYMYHFVLNLLLCPTKKNWTGCADLLKVINVFLKKKTITCTCVVLSVSALFSIDHFHPHGQLQCQFIVTKESVYILKKIVKLSQDLSWYTNMAVVSLFWNVMWKRSIFCKTVVNNYRIIFSAL